jgi:hypothetical protein
LIGLTTSQGLLEGLCQGTWQTKQGEGFVPVTNPVRLETHILGEGQRIVELSPVLLLAPTDRGNVTLLTVQEMSERYRVATGQSTLRSKEMQN